ncbi:uncharacterized protein LOC112693580 isoform X2 [Sipha flava]|nr:uncharacterized protein LOC112693580 isoform X2 [Sipha flava]XP_025424489.1 uncharacterized protein LOC112693580 isoform X2 [Sipha flava]
MINKMKMLKLSNIERRKLMRLNIIRHRETLLKYLGNIDDTTLRNKINKLHPSNVIDSNLIEELKQESPVKVEVKEEVIYEEQPKPKSEDEISVGSNNEWQSICESKIETPVETRRSSRLELVKKDAHHSTRREDFVYDVPHANGIRSNPKKNCSKRQVTASQKIPIPVKKNAKVLQSINNRDRSLHNAKERACRQKISKLFDNLKKQCSYLESNRRYPSKHSILMASKKECDLLKIFEKKLTVEIKELAEINANLKKKLEELSNVDHSKKSKKYIK